MISKTPHASQYVRNPNIVQSLIQADLEELPEQATLLKSYQEAIKNSGNKPELLNAEIEQFLSLINNGEIVKAVTGYFELLKSEPKNFIVQYELFRVLNAAHAVTIKLGISEAASEAFIGAYEILVHHGYAGMNLHLLALNHYHGLGWIAEYARLKSNIEKIAPNLTARYDVSLNSPVAIEMSHNFSEIAVLAGKLNQVRRMFSMGPSEYEGALKVIDEVLGSDTTINAVNAEFIYLKAMILDNQKVPLEGVYLFSQLIAAFPKNIKYLRSFETGCANLSSYAAFLMAKKTDYESLRAVYNILKDLHYPSHDLSAMIVNHELERGNKLEANEIAENYLNLYPSDVEIIVTFLNAIGGHDIPARAKLVASGLKLADRALIDHRYRELYRYIF